MDEAAVQAIERPHPRLMTYYALGCLATGPGFILLILPRYFRYHTMRYRFEREAISMRWGILFRREILLNYSRIQDIHLRSNLIERWLGLARLQIQTASGSAEPEMTIEGVLEYEAVRDFLYSKMRGVREDASQPSRAASGRALPAQSGSAAPPAANSEELAALLREVCSELRELRREVSTRGLGFPVPKDRSNG
jgi:putative membrane protein